MSAPKAPLTKPPRKPADPAREKPPAKSAPPCVFCAVLSGAAPAHLVLDEPTVCAFLDTTPLFPGHLLVVPRAHLTTLPELPADELPVFFGAIQRLARVLPDALDAQGTFVANNNVVSQSVPHLHVHVVPRTKGDGLKGFFWPRTKYRDDAEMASIAARIRALL